MERENNETTSNNKEEEEEKDTHNMIVVKPSENLQNKKIKYQTIGEEGCEIDVNDEDISLISRRIGSIKNLDLCSKLKVLSLRQNLIEKIEGLENLIFLEELELYDNRLKKIENIGFLVNLRCLLNFYFSIIVTFHIESLIFLLTI